MKVEADLLFGSTLEESGELIHRHVVGSLRGELFMALLAVEDGFDPATLADDMEADLGRLAATVYDRQGHFRRAFDHVVTRSSGNVLYLRSLVVDVAHRGMDLGIALMQETLDLVPHDIAALEVRPLQFTGADGDPRSPQYEGCSRNETTVTRTLRRHYAKIGFSMTRGGFVFRSPDVQNPRVQLEQDRVDARLADLPVEPPSAKLAAALRRQHRAFDEANSSR
jgi:hypothetical protein